MKKILNKFLFASLLATTLFACKKDENRVYFESGTAPVLTASTATIALSALTETQQAIRLNWTNPNYQFTTGISSHDVNYQIEIDTLRANFNSPNKKTIALSKDLSLAISVKDFNDYLLNQLLLKPKVAYTLQMRVKAFLGTGALMLTSNVITATATPYALPPKVAIPATGELFIVGSATPGGWNNPVPVPAQKFNQISETLYEITLPLTGGGAYLAIPKNGDWGAKYGFDGAKEKNNTDSDNFRAGGEDLKAPASDGTYKVRFDFQTGRFSVVKQ